MKAILISSLFILSTTAIFAKTPATEVLKNIITSGQYEGRNETQKCLVTINFMTGSTSISIDSKNSHDFFTLSNSETNYTANEEMGQLSANHSLNYPHYLNGGITYLNVKENDIEQIEISISNIMIDHRGNENSTFSSCTISL